MDGLLLAERYYKYYGLPMMQRKFPEYINRAAIGLVGEGSDCFGFDDEISRDHDWGPGFCIWLCEQDYLDIGEALQKEYYKLPKSFAGIRPRNATRQGIGRIGVIEIKRFYKNYTMLDDIPSTWEEWINIPEENLAAATNGKVFKDPFGEFSYNREKLLEYYPEDVRLRKIAERCIVIGREGQYNMERSAKRKDFTAARLAESRFIEAVVSLSFLLNYRYTPFYKWMHRGLLDLPLLGAAIHEQINRLVIEEYETGVNNLYDEKIEVVNIITAYLAGELIRQQLSDKKSLHMLDHVNGIMDKIENEEIRIYKSKGKI